MFRYNSEKFHIWDKCPMGLNRETGKSRYGHAAVTGSNTKYAIGEIREGW